MNQLEQVIRESPVILHEEPYAVARVPAAPARTDGHFAVLMDETETTVVTKESMLAACNPTQAEGPFALLEFRVAVPFQAPGFLATICSRLAQHRINVLVYSTFSRDYVMVPWADAEESSRLLHECGFTVTPRS